MSKPKHTTGKWTFSEPWTSAPILKIKSDSGRVIATINNPKTPCDNEDWANAQLIATAPELLSALEELAEIAGDAWPERPCVVYAREILDKAKYTWGGGTPERGA